MVIQEIIKDIDDFNSKIESHNEIVKSLVQEVTKEILIKYKELDDIKSKNSIESSLKLDIASQVSKLRLEKVNLNTNIKFLKESKESIVFDESKRNKLRKDLLYLENKINSLNNDLELLKVENRQQSINNEDLHSDETSIKSEILKLHDRQSEVVISLDSNKEKLKLGGERYNILLTNIDMKQIDLDNMKSSESELRESINSLNDIIASNNSEILTKESINNSFSESLKSIKEEIKAGNEIKDNIAKVIDNERKKNRNDENKVLAIKKEVLGLIMVYRNIGDKKKMAELAKAVENV